MLSSITNSPLFGTIICLVLVYALLSLLVSTVTEIINSYFNERGKLLYNVITKLFEDGLNSNFGKLLYAHPMIVNLRKNANSLPQYISNEMFSQVMIDVVGNFGRNTKADEDSKAILAQTGSSDPFQRFLEGIDKMQHSDLKTLLLNIAEKSMYISGTDLSKRIVNLDAQLQQWYRDQMDRTSGWFKDMMGTRIRVSSLIITLLLNVNSIYLFKSLYKNPDLRSEIEPIADQVASNYGKQLSDSSLSEYQNALRAVALTQFKKAKTDTSLVKLDSLLASIQKLDSIRSVHDSLRIVDFKQTSDLLHDIAGLGIPIGWHGQIPPINWTIPDRQSHELKGTTHSTWSQVLYVSGEIFWWIIGIVITTFSISVGAPFWFDMLLKLVNLRKAGKKPNE